MKEIKKIFTQTAWQVFARSVGAISNLAVLALVTRSFGESGTGVFTLALTYLAIFFLITDAGLNAYVLPRFSKDANKLFNFRLVWSIILVVLANLGALILPFENLLFNQAVLIGSLSIVLSGIYTSTNLIFQKNLRFDKASIASSIGALSQIPVVYYLISLNSPVSLITLGPLVGWLINNLISLLFIKKLYEFRILKIDLNYPLKTIKTAWPISATLLLNVVYFRADAFILSTFHSFAEVGTYNLAYSVFSNVLVFPTFIMNSFYPLMLNSLAEGKKIFIDKIKLSAIILLAVAILGMLLTWFLSPFIIGVIAGGGFAGSSASLRILSLGFPAFFVSSLLMWTMLSLKKYQSLVLVYAVGLVVNLILNFIFIPQYSYMAAAWITGISEYLILILQLIILVPILKK